MIKKKETVFVSEGYHNESVKRVVENNPWLLEMDYVDLNPEYDNRTACWNNSERRYARNSFLVLLNADGVIHLITFDIQEEKCYDILFGGEVSYDFVQYFKDWTKPTEQEKDYFEMIYGVRIPWSEEQPLVLD